MKLTTSAAAPLIDAVAEDEAVAVPPMSLGARLSTRQLRWQAVERAVAWMRTNFDRPISHDELARVACFSPYHFNRFFRVVTGVPPLHFLTAVRMAEAKRLLLTTPLRVTDVCFGVGFASLGTFTTRFGELVGVAPQELRALAIREGGRPLAELVSGAEGGAGCDEHGLTLEVDTPLGTSCVAFVGLFDAAAPEGVPSACAVLSAPGKLSIGPVPPGTYSALAIGYPDGETVLDALLTDERRLLIGSVGAPMNPGGRRSARAARLSLRPRLTVDPPLVFAAPAISSARALEAATAA